MAFLLEVTVNQHGSQGRGWGEWHRHYHIWTSSTLKDIGPQVVWKIPGLPRHATRAINHCPIAISANEQASWVVRHTPRDLIYACTPISFLSVSLILHLLGLFVCLLSFLVMVPARSCIVVWLVAQMLMCGGHNWGGTQSITRMGPNQGHWERAP